MSASRPTTGYHAPPRGPLDVSLADVYRLDFGQRDADLPTWAALAAATNGPVLDVGCGDGRATRALAAAGRAVLGLDEDPRFVTLARQAGIDAKQGSANDPRAYDGRPLAGLALCAYSTLWLVPHRLQGDVLACMAEAVAPGGLVAVEVFVPSLAESRVVEQPCADPSDPCRPPWLRQSSFTVDAARRVTTIQRLYGPARGEWTMRLGEVVHWRDPAELVLLARRAGLVDVATWTGEAYVLDSVTGVLSRVPVAPGHALLLGRR